MTLPPAAIALTAAGQGGWNQQSDYKAVRYNGKTYFGWVASNGDVKIASYTHATGVVSAATTLHATLAVDVHVSPSIVVRDSDQRLMVAYTQHDTSTFCTRISTNAEDETAWGGEVAMDGALGGNTYTYPSIFQQLGQAGDPIQIMYRDVQDAGLSGALCYTYTTDHDASPTWQAQATLYKNANKQSYWKVACDGNIRIDVVTTDGHPVTDAPTKLCHMYSDATDWHESDGTVLGALPYGPSDLTEIDDGAGGSCWPMNVVANGGNPVVVYWRGTYGGGSMDIVYARWSGAAWVKTVIATNGGPGGYAPGGAVIDESDPDTVYASVWNGARYSLRRYVTADSGATWTWAASIDGGQSDDSIWPAVVRNSAAGLRVVWLHGTITADDTYTLAVSGA